MNGFGLTVMGPWPQFTVALALTSALTSATAGTARSRASWTERANEGEGVAATATLAASTVAHRTLEAQALIGSVSATFVGSAAGPLRASAHRVGGRHVSTPRLDDHRRRM